MKRKSLCPADRVSGAERWLGYLIGPLGFGFLSIMVGSYLNVYYTDVCGLGRLWGGSFMSVYPILVKILDVITYLAAGWLVDRTHSRAGKARPWILLSAVLLPISAMLLFLVPQGNDWLTAAAVLGSNVFYFAVVVTLYATANTLLVPLASCDPAERSKLAVTVNAQSLITGSAVALLFPMVILPIIGVEQHRWILLMLLTAVVAVPLLLVQYLFTRERVTEQSTSETVKTPQLSLRQQLSCCRKSNTWSILMLYFALMALINSLSSVSTFYYCNWVLGEYNDGFTQVLFYAVGNFPMGIGVFACNPLCRRFGRDRVLKAGFLISAVGLAFCLLRPTSLSIVLTGQIIKACGTIPASYLSSVLLGEALDDVQLRSGQRCDGFTSSLYNSICTIMGGLAVSLLNAGMAIFGYIAPSATCVTPQPAAVQNFFTICQLALPMLTYPCMALLLHFGLRRKPEAKNQVAA